MRAISRNTDTKALEARFALRITGALNAQAEDLPRDVGERLRFARHKALAQARQARAASASGVVGVAPSGVLLLGMLGPWLRRAASLAPLLLLLGGLLLIQQWSVRERVLAAAEIDTLLLADDLPPSAYRDPGFAEFLRFGASTVTVGFLPRLSTAVLLWLLLAVAGVARSEAPAWAALTAQQRQALSPLQRDWPSIDAGGREKWLEIAARFPAMSAEEQKRLQERMSSWSRLTPAERAQARLNFQETRRLPAEEKQARWEAYQALTEDERKALSQRTRPPAKGAAGADLSPRAGALPEAGTAKNNLVLPRSETQARPVAPAVVNARPGATTTTVSTPAVPPAHHQPGLPKIAATPGFVDEVTLLPKRGPQGAAVRGRAASAPAAKP